MLVHLEISNIALIDRISIDFSTGFNVMTGETGAGKSILIDAISTLMGQRTSREIIRSGEETAYVEGVFLPPEHTCHKLISEFGIEIEKDDSLILSRELSLTGKNICKVNNRLVTVSLLKQIGEELIDIHGQHDNQSLLKSENHLYMLDSYSGKDVSTYKDLYNNQLAEYKKLKNTLNSLSGSNEERERKMDFLNYQIQEIKTSNIYANEDIELKEKKYLLENQKKILDSLIQSYQSISAAEHNDTCALDMLRDASVRLNSISQFDEEFNDFSEQIDSFIYSLDEISTNIRRRFEEIENNPTELLSINERIDFINTLKRKYGKEISDIFRRLEAMEQEYYEIKDNEKTALSIENEISSLELKLTDTAVKLSKERILSASRLEKRITDELEDLDLKGSVFKVCINKTADANIFKSNGMDDVEFMISTNPGEPVKTLTKVASGGEMSRVMLAIKKILSDVDFIPTLIFDEIDNGIGGKTANSVAEKIKFISLNHQVICVTHLASIAASSNYQYKIEKKLLNDRTVTSIEQLDYTGRIKEIARLLGDDISEISLKHASQMLSEFSK